MSVTELGKFAYEEIKKDKKYRYAIFFVNDDNQIDLDVVGHRNASYETFVMDIQRCGPNECRYGVFDFEYWHQCTGAPERAKKEKLLLISWCPYTASVKNKILYTSLLGALQKSLDGIYTNVQATDLTEASRETVEEKLRACDHH